MADQPEPAGLRDLGILLAQRPGRGVARVRIRRLARFDHLGVQLEEVLDPEVHLAAHLAQGGHGESRAAGELLRNLLERADVEYDVLTRPAVTTGARPRDVTGLVYQ